MSIGSRNDSNVTSHTSGLTGEDSITSKARIEKVTKELEKILQTETEPNEFNIRKISLEVISFIMSFTVRDSDMPLIEELGKKTVKKILDFGNELRLSRDSIDSQKALREIFSKLECKCQHQEILITQTAEEVYNAKKRKKRQQEGTKEWRTAEETKKSVEEKQRKQQLKAEKRRLKHERQERKRLEKERLEKLREEEEEEEEDSDIQKSCYLDSEIAFDSDEFKMHIASLMTQSESTESKIGSKITSDEELTMSSGSEYLSDDFWFFSMSDVGEQIRRLYIDTSGENLQEFLTIRKFAAIFIDTMISLAEVKVQDRLVISEVDEEESQEVEIKDTMFDVESEMISDMVSASIKVLTVGPYTITIGEFTPVAGQKIVDAFIKSWKHERNWCYCIDYAEEQCDSSSDFHLYEVKWSCPSEKYPIPQATVSVYFTIEVPRILPLRCPVKITYSFEGNSYIYSIDSVVKHEKFLIDTLEYKLNLFKQINF